jgi:hypothetical protein
MNKTRGKVRSIEVLSVSPRCFLCEFTHPIRLIFMYFRRSTAGFCKANITESPTQNGVRNYLYVSLKVRHDTEK